VDQNRPTGMPRNTFRNLNRLMDVALGSCSFVFLIAVFVFILACIDEVSTHYQSDLGNLQNSARVDTPSLLFGTADRCHIMSLHTRWCLSLDRYLELWVALSFRFRLVWHEMLLCLMIAFRWWSLRCAQLASLLHRHRSTVCAHVTLHESTLSVPDAVRFATLFDLFF
jgi:hypothetical protein